MMRVNTPKTIISSMDISKLLGTTNEEGDQDLAECQQQNEGSSKRINLVFGEAY